jgi:hypothetical protein
MCNTAGGLLRVFEVRHCVVHARVHFRIQPSYLAIAMICDAARGLLRVFEVRLTH